MEARGVGGWSYGGILTDEVIARDHRFKAATSGAGIANALTGYGTDQYVKEHEAELGTPWHGGHGKPQGHCGCAVHPPILPCNSVPSMLPW